MLDIGWSEILVIAVVAIIVVGPKDLPRMLRAFGKTLGQVRRTANDFKRQFDDALKEAEREVDLADTRKSLESITRIDPLADLKKDISGSPRQGSSPGALKPAAAAAGGVNPDAPAPYSAIAPAPKADAGSDAA